MRSVLFRLLLLLLVPTAVSAGPIVDHYYTTGQLHFGHSQAYQFGWGPYGLDANGRNLLDEFDIDATTYEMTSGDFLVQEILTDAGGDAIQSTYFYEPGELVIDFELRSLATAEVTHGFFRAPVNMTVVVDERRQFGADIDSLFTLGPGVFDADIARVLGVRRQTVGGFVRDDFIDVTGDSESDNRIALDAAFFTIEVPEPGTAALGVLSLAALWLRRRRRPGR